ncbi:MAG: GMC family oxidoreductase N-terminal domain-containing protein [Hyphomicrobiaceae bacterium]
MLFDYVIVGAGSAGSALAARLSANGRFTVALIEAGPSDRRFWIQTPIGYAKTFNDASVNWMFTSEPVPGLGGRVLPVPRGKVLGGSSSINALVYIRGQAADYDDWREMGNTGWGWQDVLPYFRRLEDYPNGDPALHGKGGPVGITDPSRQAHRTTKAYYDGAIELGIPYNPDFNGATQEGVGPYHLTVRGGLRSSAARAYLWPSMSRKNLFVETEALVTRIVFEGRRAVGIDVRKNGETLFLRAQREVILSSGAIGSPQLLQVSGVGPSALLKEHGIPIVHVNESVGQNLQEHAAYDHYYRAKVRTMNATLYPWWGQAFWGAMYLAFRRGPLSLSINQGGGFVRSSPDRARPNMQLYFCPMSFQKAPAGSSAFIVPDKQSGFSLTVSPCRPHSRGWVKIKSADPSVAPMIQPNLLADHRDVAEMLEGARLLRQLRSTEALSAIIDHETMPGAEVQDDAALIEDIRAKTNSIYHPSCSCRMGTDPMSSVVDPKLKVHGVSGLRIIDASVFPTVTSGNLNGPSLMVGEKGADLVVADTRG